MQPWPDFYDPARVDQLTLERAGLVTETAEAFARHHHLSPASEDRFRVAAFGIDVQVAFCIPGAPLFVPGAVEDTRRTIEWLYRNCGRVTSLFFSMDTHSVFQIFHPAWWVDGEGRHPAPMTPISAADVRRGRWMPTRHPQQSLAYVEQLEASGRYMLTIWPYHALLGGLSHALVPAMHEAALFHAAARRAPTHFEMKGSHPLTENYSALSPEVTTLGTETVGAFNTRLAEALFAHDRVYVFGQAKSHCVASTLDDLLAFARRTDAALARKVWILEDAMSPVPPPPMSPLPPHLDFPRLAEAALERFRSAGMRVVKTSDPVTP